MQDLSLAKLDEAIRAIAEATTVQEIKSGLDWAKTAEVYAKQAKLGKDVELKAAEYIVRAERMLGEMLAAAKTAGQITKLHTHKRDVPKENISSFTLSEAGIDRKLSSRAQKVAAIPKEDFEQRVVEGKESGKLTSKTVMRVAQSPNGAKPEKAKEPHKDQQEDEVWELSEAGLTTAEIAEEIGRPYEMSRQILKAARIRHSSEPAISRDDLSLTAQQKLDIAIRQHKAKLRAEFQEFVKKKVTEYLENYHTPRLVKELEEAKQESSRFRPGIMPEQEYKKIQACLHPDWVTDLQQKDKYTEAFRIFTSYKRRLLGTEQCPPDTSDVAPVPATMEEWEELRRQVKARKAKGRPQSEIAKK